MNDRQWLQQALPKGEEHPDLAYLFIFEGELLATDRHRIHEIKVPPKLAQSLKGDEFALCTREKGRIDKDMYIDRHKDPADITVVLDSLEARGELLDIGLWMDRDEYTLEHLMSGTILKKDYFNEVVGEEPGDWFCYICGVGGVQEAEHLLPICFQRRDGERTAYVMGVKS